MISINFVIGAGIIFVLILLAVVFLVPDETRRGKKRIRQQLQELEKQKNWQKIAEGKERHIQALRKEVDLYRKKERDAQDQIIREKDQVKKLNEKLDQHRGWQKREQHVLEKKGKDFKNVKESLVKIQEELGKEHSVNLRFKQELKELKREYTMLREKYRTIETGNMQLKTKGGHYRQEILQLKKENIQLSKKNDGDSWIAKSDYSKLEEAFKMSQQELGRARRGS